MQEAVRVKNIDISGPGIFTEFHDVKHKYPGYPDPDIFPRLDVVKRSLMMVLRNSWLLLIFKKHRQQFLYDFRILVERAFNAPLKKYWLDPRMYCKSGREIYRVSSQYHDDTLSKAVCILWEYDNAYRFRGQDFLTMYQTRGLFGAIDGLIERSTDQDGMIRKFKQIRILLKTIRFLKPSLFRAIIKILNELDIKEIEFTPADKYFCYFKKGYDYCGLTYEERLSLRPSL